VYLTGSSHLQFSPSKVYQTTMFTSNSCRFVLFYFLSLSANAEKGGLRVLDESESTADTSKGLTVGGADDAHRMLAEIPITDADLAGKTLCPGTYTAAAALGLTGTLILTNDENCPSVANPAWIFKIGGAFSAAAASKVEFSSQSSGTVRWLVTGAITLGADADFIHSQNSYMRSSAGAISTGAGAKCGSLHADGAITVGAGKETKTWNLHSFNGAVTVGADAFTQDIFAQGAITLGAGAVTHTIRACGAISMGADVEFEVIIPCDPSADTGDGDNEISYADLNGKTLPAGTYTAAAALALTGTLTLNCYGDESAADEWTFVIGGAFSAAAASNIQFTGECSVKKVTWDVTGAITLGADADFTEFSNMVSTAAISVGAGAKCGDIDAAGAITIGAGADVGDLKADAAVTVGAAADYGNCVGTGCPA
jgi:hypothetical protein